MTCRCPTCRQEFLSEGVIDERRTVAGYPFEAQLNALVCSCGESLVEGAVLQRFESEIALALSHCEPSGAAFTFMRKKLALNRSGVADLLALSEDTLKAWEAEACPIDPTAWMLVCLMIQERSQGNTATRDLLTRFAQSRRTAVAPRLKLGHLAVQPAF